MTTKKTILVGAVVVAVATGAGVLGGMRLARPRPTPASGAARTAAAPARRVVFYRSPMDPSIRSAEPAKDSMGMEFIPVYEDELGAAEVTGRATVILSPERRRVLGLRSEPVRETALARTIRTVGRVAPDERRLHRETVAFLHEWAHTAGAVHECDNKWIMSETYRVTASGFSPESERLVRLTLASRGKTGAAARTAFVEAWRAEVARMQSAAWECPVLEKGLAEQDALLAKAISDADARPARSP
jgi:hypothetical protein